MKGRIFTVYEGLTLSKCVAGAAVLVGLLGIVPFMAFSQNRAPGL
jgi:hypothetical protein